MSASSCSNFSSELLIGIPVPPLVFWFYKCNASDRRGTEEGADRSTLLTAIREIAALGHEQPALSPRTTSKVSPNRLALEALVNEFKRGSNITFAVPSSAMVGVVSPDKGPVVGARNR